MHLVEFLFWNVPELKPWHRLSMSNSSRVPFTTRHSGDTVREPMGILRTDRRREQRTPIDITLLVWGVDTHGERFLQEAHARDISLSGALLSGLETDIRSGDVIGILCGKRKARFRVVWVRYDDSGDKMLVAVQRLAADACPWPELLNEASESASARINPPSDSPTP